MIVFIVLGLAFGLPLALYAPAPESLTEVHKTGFKSRIRSSAGTLAIGFVMIMVAAAAFDSNNQIDPDAMEIFALSRHGIFENGFVFQLLTSNLLHIDLFHLVADLFVLLLMSAYERRAGWRRFAVVFLVAVAVSSLGDLFRLQPGTAIMGASAGLCGLAAAYFLDLGDLTLWQWIKGVLLVLFIVGVYSYIGPAGDLLAEDTGSAAHLLGVCAGAAYVFWVPGPGSKSQQTKCVKQTPS